MRLAKGRILAVEKWNDISNAYYSAMDSRLRDPGLFCLPPETMTQHAVIQPLKAEPLSLFARDAGSEQILGNSVEVKILFDESWVRVRIDPDGQLVGC